MPDYWEEPSIGPLNRWVECGWVMQSDGEVIGHRVPPDGCVDILYDRIEDFADILRRLEGYPIAVADRVTAYGMREIEVHEPSGHVVVFAARSA